ncbi:bacterial alpha-L-rhamnosidase-domain-containing protein [Aspergillus karnatakaensis]|uniref:bacterial alpha-L-rhamnosidase-domain-containing protein n=1 Tax=Aspergillus karnatakaensis TaxID=1810916 RepID=UPI003CCDB5EF
MSTPQIVDVRFEHHPPCKPALGVHDTQPRISWRFADVKQNFTQTEYEIELTRSTQSNNADVTSTRIASDESHLVPWPHPNRPLIAGETSSIRVRAWGKGNSDPTPWSKPAVLETGLLERADWSAKFISSPWAGENLDKPQPEDLFRREFALPFKAVSARLYITALGVYEAELNGKRVGDYFLAPGWTSYHDRLHYQTYDVNDLLNTSTGDNCLGIRVAEGWYKGRMGFGGRRNHYGERTAALAQLDVRSEDGRTHTVGTDGSWSVARGPAQQGEIYDGEVYDARVEIEGWSRTGLELDDRWKSVDVLPPLPAQTSLVSGNKPPARRLETIKPVQTIRTPSGKMVLDFGQNLVGVLRVGRVRAPAGHELRLQHAEVLENGELGLRPLRDCKARDIYTFRGDVEGEAYEPRFTFHGFRYAQVDGWPSLEDPTQHIEAVVCHTVMEEAGTFACSDLKVNQLFSNTKWSMRGNFLSIPTDCPQRDERLGWTGDLALFGPTATLIYQCFGIIKDWLHDLAYEQGQQGGIPPMVVPDVLQGWKTWGDATPCAVWQDVAVLAPWALWEETKDISILEQQYESMGSWLRAIPRNKDRLTHLWDLKRFQLADWLDPNAPPDDPQKAVTDPVLVANAFLVRCLAVMAEVASILDRKTDIGYFRIEYEKSRAEFVEEYVSPSGRIISDSQTAYALAICFSLLTPAQTAIAGNRLAEVVKANQYKIGTGFAGTPFVCEALAETGHEETAYKMLLNETCPSWLYPISMGATTIWERWDSMKPDGSINGGEMTSFNHYAFGAVSKFLIERLAGLQRVGPGWKHSKIAPLLGGGFTSASASHVTPYGLVSCQWDLSGETVESGLQKLSLEVVVPPTTTMEVELPTVGGTEIHRVGSGTWSFASVVRND